MPRKKVKSNVMYTAATKTMPPKMGDKYILTLHFDKATMVALNKFVKESDFSTRGASCRSMIKSFLRKKGYIKS